MMRVDVQTGHLMARDARQIDSELEIDARADISAIDFGDQLGVCIIAASFGDGSAFSQTSHLRRLGFAGTICIKGAVLPDQIHMARGVGADMIQPNADILVRQNPQAWAEAGSRYRLSYRDRLKQAV